LALSQVDRTNLRAFKINIEDPRNATTEEEAFAAEYDVRIRHTKIWIVDSEEVLDEIVQYDEATYLSKFSELLGLSV
jgi:hypothetical protein